MGKPEGDDRVATDNSATWRSYGIAVLVITSVTLLGVAAEPHISATDVSMLYLLAIMFSALGGRGPATVAATLGVASFDFFFVPPRFTFAVTDARFLLTFVVMFAVGQAVSTLILRLQRQEQAAYQRERHTAALLAFSRDLAAASNQSDVATALVRHLEDAFASPAAVLLPSSNHDGSSGLVAAAGLAPLAAQELTVARWAFEHGQEAGVGTATLSAARSIAIPLLADEHPIGVVAIARPRDALPLAPPLRHLLDGLIRQAALALSRQDLANQARFADVRARTEELRSSLLSAVSHDLRTPLAVITGAATAIRDRGEAMLAATRDELIDTVVVEAQRLERVLANLLELTRVEAGFEPRRDWVVVEELVGAVLGRMDSQANASIETDVPGDLMIPVDAVLFEHVLQNLVDNAIKYGAPPIEIRARAVPGDDVVELVVRDHGRGMPAGQEERIFEKFVRADGVTGPGVGLGLAVSRAIVTAHGGILSATTIAPSDGGGASFSVVIPARHGSLAAPPDVSAVNDIELTS